MFCIFRRLRLLEQRVIDMDSRIQAIADAEAALETVVDAVIADHQALVDRLNSAIAANDWSGVEDVATHLTATADRLKGILPSA